MPLCRSATVLCALGVCAAVISPAAAQESGTVGFVIRDWFTAMYETPFIDECPEGLNIGSDEFWWRSQSREHRAQITGNGLARRPVRYYEVLDRGPQNEDICLNPTGIKDAPFRVVEGEFGYGDNLDGTTDGSATAKSCRHEKFRSPDGQTAVDNQLYRLVGCTFGWRKSGLVELNSHEVRGTSGRGMILVEITGVEDPRNSDNVTVTFYRSIDQFALDNNGAPLPFSSYRIETADGQPRYGDSLKGSIKDGRLQTERGDIQLPYYANDNFTPLVLKDMSLRLDIEADGSVATGMITGYYDVEKFMYSVGGMGQVSQTAQFSCPAMYVAARQLADGYPDPKTGECTMLSSAFNIKAYAAFVLHPEQEQRQAAR